MTWAILLPIILRDGIPAAMRLWQLVTTNAEITQADWDSLEALSQKTYDDYIREAEARRNVYEPPNTPTP